jgi:hypothetical protein
MSATSRSVLLIVSVDTEEDNWQPRRDGVTVENIRELPRLDALLRRLGVRATYFTTYQVAIHQAAVSLLRELRAGGAEIGAHLHPWNTPPLDEPLLPRNSMLTNLPAALQLAKLERLTDTLRRAIGTGPLAFRAGRYALGPETVRALIRCGYQVDSSVTPHVSWEAFDDGPSFVGAPVGAYRLGGGNDVRIPQPGGALLEIPMSIGFSRTPFGVWSRIRRMLASPVLRPLHLAGLAARVGLIKRIFLSPEMQDVPDMLTLSRHLIDQGVGCLHLFFHSGSLRAGLSPYSPDQAAVDCLYGRIVSYVEQLARTTSLTFVTVSEAAARLEAPETPLTSEARRAARAPIR